MPDIISKNDSPWSKEQISALVSTHRFPLLYFAVGIVGNIADAEDVVEDAFVRLLIKKPRLRDDTAIRSYLYSTVKNRAIDHLRKQKRDRAHAEALATVATEDLYLIEKQLCQNETRHELFDASRTLSPNDRQLVYLRYFEELPPRRIAQILSKPVKYVYNRIGRIQKQLADILHKEVTTDENS